MSKKAQLMDLLNEFQLTFVIHEHDPVFTVDESKHISAKIKGAHSKNLFLKDKKKSFFLLSILDYKRVDLKAFSKRYGRGGVSFANVDELHEKLHLTPGSVTPYALIHDKKKEVKFLLDEDFLKFDIVNFHPLQNDLTLSMDINDFLRFFKLIHHYPEIIQIPELNQLIGDKHDF